MLDRQHLSDGPSGGVADEVRGVDPERIHQLKDVAGHLLERRAATLAGAISVPLETLDVALANWGSSQRATLGFPADTRDQGALDRAADALGI